MRVLLVLTLLSLAAVAAAPVAQAHCVPVLICDPGSGRLCPVVATVYNGAAGAADLVLCHLP